MSTKVIDAASVVVSSPTAQGWYDGPAAPLWAAGRRPVPLSPEALRSMPAVLLDPLRERLEHWKVYAYLIPLDGEQFEIAVLNQPLRIRKARKS